MIREPVTVVGVSHRSAPLAERERFALAEGPARALLEEHAEERMLLVTCNRTELYGTEHAAVLRSRLVAATNPLRSGPGDRPDRDDAHVFALQDEAAVRHLFTVSAGLDSMVIGEPQILGQVKRAMKAARAADSLGPVLDELARRALTVGRRVRTETDLGRGMPSIPKVAAGVARLVLGNLDGRLVLVVGTGKMGGLTARTLSGAGAGDVVVTNRTPEAAALLARRVGGRAEPWDALDRLLAEADIAIACTASQAPILARERLARVVEERAGRPLVIVDIAVPRDVAADARSLKGLRLYDLDDLRGWGSDAAPPEAMSAAESIVDEEARAFTAWQESRAAIPTIKALRARGEAILERELARTSAEDAEAMARFGRRLMRKLLHDPTVRLRDRTAREGDTYIEVARDLFALGPEDDAERR